MLKRIAIPDFTPDTPLTTLRGANLIAMPNGYRPAKAFSPVTAALSGILDGAAYIGSDGSTCLLGGTATNLYRYAGGAWTSLIGSLTATQWRFDQFGDNVIAVNGGAPVSYAIIAGTAAALGGSPPNADMVATVRNQVFLAGNSSAQATVYISGYNNSAQWTAGTNQSLVVPFPSGGRIMGLCGGETGIILQQQSVRRAIYNGDGVTWWQFDEISRDVGCMAKGSVAQAGELVFFLSDQGFKVCDRNQVLPIGSETVDRTFFATYPRVEIVDKIRAAVDPQTTTVTWIMPGTPGRLWSYNWTLKKWSPPIEASVKNVFKGFSQSYALEDLNALYPSGLESVPVSLDATMFAGGNPLFFAISTGDIVGTLTGDNLAASITIPPIEIAPGKRVRITAVRVVGDVTAGAVSIDARARAGDSPNVKVSGAIRDNGRVPVRANGRHTGVTLDIPSHIWSYAQALDVEYTVEGSR